MRKILDADLGRGCALQVCNPSSQPFGGASARLTGAPEYASKLGALWEGIASGSRQFSSVQGVITQPPDHQASFQSSSAVKFTLSRKKSRGLVRSLRS